MVMARKDVIENKIPDEETWKEYASFLREQEDGVLEELKEFEW
jgi:hypothetical protein